MLNFALSKNYGFSTKRNVYMLVLILSFSRLICGDSSGNHNNINISPMNAEHEDWKNKDLYISNGTIEHYDVATVNNEVSSTESILLQGNYNEFNITVTGTICRDPTESPYPDPVFERFLRIKRYMDPIMMIIIFTVGTTTNIVLIVILTKRKEMHTSSNACLFSMAIGHLMSLVVNIPIFYLLLVSEKWTVGVGLCKLMWFFSDFSVGVSIFSVAMLSYQRYRSIVELKKQFHIGPRTLKSFLSNISHILPVWIVSFYFAARTAVTSNVTNYTCTSIDAGLNFKKYIVLFNLFVFCIIPLCIITVYYGLTAHHLIKGAKCMSGDMSTIQQRSIDTRRNGVKIVLGLTTCFFISYVPWYLWQVIYYWEDYSNDYKITTYSFTFLYYLFFGNICFNPISLYCVSSTFRNYYNHYLSCGKIKVKHDDESINTGSVKIKGSTTSNTEV